jgi:hypothetical protein
MLVGEQRMFPAPGFLDGAIDDALGRVGQLGHGNVEIVFLHVALRPNLLSGVTAIRGPIIGEWLSRFLTD